MAERLVEPGPDPTLSGLIPKGSRRGIDFDLENIEGVKVTKNPQIEIDIEVNIDPLAPNANLISGALESLGYTRKATKLNQPITLVKLKTGPGSPKSNIWMIGS